MNTTLLRSTAFVVAIVGSTASANQKQLTVDLSSWDTDDDKMVSAEEWTRVIGEYHFFARVDANGNGIFDAAEANEGLLDYDLAMDLDSSGTIDREEFTLGVFAKHDVNGDANLEDIEWMELVVNSDGAPLFN